MFPPERSLMAEVFPAHTSGGAWKVTLVLNGRWGQGAGSAGCGGGGGSGGNSASRRAGRGQGLPLVLTGSRNSMGLGAMLVLWPGTHEQPDRSRCHAALSCCFLSSSRFHVVMSSSGKVPLLAAIISASSEVRSPGPDSVMCSVSYQTLCPSRKICWLVGACSNGTRTPTQNTWPQTREVKSRSCEPKGKMQPTNI